MFDREKMQIWFPHVIPGNRLADREYTWNDVNGGIKTIANMGLQRNKFFGGQVTVLGLIKELGIWACQHYETRRIIGFYVDDPMRVTDNGRKLLRERFSDCEVMFEKYSPEVAKLSPEERKRKQELLEELRKYGQDVTLISHTTAEGLEGLLKAVLSGKSEKPMAEQEAPAVSEYTEKAQTFTKPTKSKRTGVMEI